MLTKAVPRIVLIANSVATLKTTFNLCPPISLERVIRLSTQNAVSPAVFKHTRIDCTAASYGAGNSSYRLKLKPAPVSNISTIIVDISLFVDIVVVTFWHRAVKSFAILQSGFLAPRE